MGMPVQLEDQKRVGPFCGIKKLGESAKLLQHRILYLLERWMMKKTFWTIAAIFFVVSPAQSATVNTIYQLNGDFAENTTTCPGLSLDVGLGTTTCTDTGNQNNNLYTTKMAARADPLSFGIRASTDVAGDSTLGFVGGSGIGGTVDHNFLDTITFGVSSGIWLLPIDVFGELSVNHPPQGPSGGGGMARANLNVTVVADGIATVLYTRQIQEITGPNGSSDDVTGSLGTTVLGLAFENGKLDLQLSLFGEVRCDGAFRDSFCESSLDFFQSARILGTTVFDEVGNVASNQTINSLSGFDYNRGAEPHDLAPIPLPAAGWMLMAGLAALVGWSRRQSTA